MDANPPRWMALLRAAVAADARGIQGVADRLGVSRTQVSLVLGGKYGAHPAALMRRVLATLDEHPCPYLGVAIPGEHCREMNTGPVPTWDPSAMEQRRTCQTCAHRPTLVPTPERRS